MRIAEVIATFPPHHGGMGYICFNNSRELARRGHEVTVFTLHHGCTYYDNDSENFRVVRLRTPLLYGDGGMVTQLYSELEGFDIVHLHYPFFGGAEYVYLSALMRGQKYFLTYHMDVYGNTALKKFIIGAYEPLLMKRIIRGAAGICGPGKAYLKSTKVAGFIDWKKFADIGYGGVDTQKYLPREKNEALMHRFGLRDKIVVLFVGNLQPFKGLHLLIDAIAEIRDENIVLLVVGGGYGEAHYKAQARNKGIEDRVIFAGPRSPDEDLPLFYNLADFLVLPSTHSESFGLVVLESMASGKPVIVSALTGPSHLVSDGEDGLITRVNDPNDLKKKIEYLAAQPEKSKMMGLTAREKVSRKYRWYSIGDKLEQTLKEICNRP